MYYYLSIGANLDPEKNIGLCIEILLETFTAITLYPPIFTEPEGVTLTKTFVNTLAVVESELDTADFKVTLESIEIRLGRNRQDPLRSYKDRQCDIDIFAKDRRLDFSFFNGSRFGYISKVFDYRSNTPKAAIAVYQNKLPPYPVHISYKGSATIHISAAEQAGAVSR